MEIKRHNIIILVSAAIIAGVISVGITKSKTSKRYNSRVFKVVNGWGYDILVNDKLIIHQESVPVLENKQQFQKSEDAVQAAQMVIMKLKKGEPPSLTKFDLEKITRLRDIETSK